MDNEEKKRKIVTWMVYINPTSRRVTLTLMPRRLKTYKQGRTETDAKQHWRNDEVYWVRTPPKI